MMYRILLVDDNQQTKVIQQVHDLKVWQKIVGGVIAIVPATSDGLAVICNRMPRFTVHLHNGVIRCPIAESQDDPLRMHPVYQNVYGKFLWVRYRNAEVVDLTDQDCFLIRGELMKWAIAGERREDGIVPLFQKGDIILS